METLWDESLLERDHEENWGKMVVFSVALHLAVLSLVFFIPRPLPIGRFHGTVYEVSLVEMPARKVSKTRSAVVSKGSRRPRTRKRSSRVSRPKPAERVGRLKAETEPLIIAKRVFKEEAPKRIDSEKSMSKLIDQAVSKIENQVKIEKREEALKKAEAEKNAALQEAIARIENQIKTQVTASGPQEGTQNGIAMQLYKVEVESRIKSNWAYPAAFMDPNKQKNLEALVVIRVNRDGGIVDSKLEKPSGNARFDESVKRAIDRSNPLPPFPEGFLKTYEEIEINFNLRELEKNS